MDFGSTISEGHWGLKIASEFVTAPMKTGGKETTNKDLTRTVGLSAATSLVILQTKIQTDKSADTIVVFPIVHCFAADSHKGPDILWLWSWDPQQRYLGTCVPRLAVSKCQLKLSHGRIGEFALRSSDRKEAVYQYRLHRHWHTQGRHESWRHLKATLIKTYGKAPAPFRRHIWRWRSRGETALSCSRPWPQNPVARLLGSPKLE